jgi:hypothetical protein
MNTTNMTATAAAINRQPEVSTEMDRLHIQCEVLDKGLSELELRLTTILAQRIDLDNKKELGGHPEPIRVPLAQAIRDESNTLVLLNERVQSIISRIEV